MRLDTIVCADAIEFMRGLPDASVDMFFADWPYGTTACAWDAIVPFAPSWAEIKRIAKPRAALVFTASQPFTTALIASNLEGFRYEWVWCKTRVTRHLDAARMPLKAHESVLVFDVAGHCYYPQMTWTGVKRSSKGGESRVYHKNGEHYYKSEGWRYPTSVLSFTMPDKERGLHPTQKPLSLMNYLIRTYSKPGDVICDPCAGSGTTAVAAIGADRHFVTCENDPEHFRTASERIVMADPYHDRIIAPGTLQQSLFGVEL